MKFYNKYGLLVATSGILPHFTMVSMETVTHLIPGGTSLALETYGILITMADDMVCHSTHRRETENTKRY